MQIDKKRGIMEYGSRELKKGLKGDDIQELQLRLAGFAGTSPDGDFGPGSEKQVIQFQKDYMGMTEPTGVVGSDTFTAIDEFATQFPIDFSKLKCECGVCKGFGQGLYKGVYREGKPEIEAYHKYEYPGIHRMILWAYRAADFYYPEHPFLFTCGYRCSVRNTQKGRKSTNHCGKAVDFDVLRQAGEDKKDDMNRCEAIRQDTVKEAKAQIGWNEFNKKSLEPANIAPTWIHYDVRSFVAKYLEDKFFCTDSEGLNGVQYVPAVVEPVVETPKKDTKQVEETNDKGFFGIILKILRSIFG